jgi:hypothetical protein
MLRRRQLSDALINKIKSISDHDQKQPIYKIF